MRHFTNMLLIALIVSLASISGQAYAENGLTICLDPGHQKVANSQPEPDGPNSRIMKPKTTSGAQGVATKKPEYELNLEVSLLVKQRLTDRGYHVIMTREENDVDVSNKERADIANAAQADLFLRIHADGDSSSRTQGMSLLYPALSNFSTKPIYQESKQAAELVLQAMLASTGAKSRGAVPRDDLSGFNWSKVPTILVEMGFLSNPEEDRQMSTVEYQQKLAAGIVQGIEAWEAEKWLNGEYSVSNEVRQVETRVTLDDPVQFYPFPFQGTEAMGELAAQTLDTFEQWNDWFHIHTWLGDGWILIPSRLSVLQTNE